MAKFVDLVAGFSVREEMDDATGISQKIVSDWRAAPRGNDLKPEVIVMNPETGEPVRLDNGNPEVHAMSVDAILSVEDGQALRPGDVIARIPREGAKTKDITGGLPRVAELFEARRPKDHAIIAEISGHVHFGKDFKNKRRITIEPVDEGLEPSSTWFRRASTSRCRKATSSRRASTSWTAILRRMTSSPSSGSRHWPTT